MLDVYDCFITLFLKLNMSTELYESEEVDSSEGSDFESFASD